MRFKLFFVFTLFIFLNCFSQQENRIEIFGRIVVDTNDVERVTIYNITSKKGTITDQKGEFYIEVALNDTLEINALQFTKVTIVIDEKNIRAKKLIVYLVEKTNELDQVVVGKILTGNLEFDLKNSDAKKDINFYDLGISGYTGKPKTQSERRLFEADNGDYVSLFNGSIVGVNFYKILNTISGRTKKLKNRVRIEALESCVNSLKSEYSEMLFKDYELKETLRLEFFYFCSDDPKFVVICKAKKSIEALAFLMEKLKMYKAVLDSVNED